MCTGNTSVLPIRVPTVPVYPCVYREHLDTGKTLNSPIGLSLCVQGTPIDNIDDHRGLRFIPVCTGNTRIFQLGIFFTTVYPCVYREHIPNLVIGVQLCGLSLCVQGTQNLRRFLIYDSRFIPVCTGNTLIITYCLLIKIGSCKILPNFCCFFRRFSLKRIRNVIS